MLAAIQFSIKKILTKCLKVYNFLGCLMGAWNLICHVKIVVSIESAWEWGGKETVWTWKGENNMGLEKSTNEELYSLYS